ncbi:MAG: phage holin family protein [Aquabacterium sp.]|nr:phage holin family protein [Aquabacterium sp.]
MAGRGIDPDGSPPSAGLFGSLQRLLATLLDIAQVRLDLLTTEFEREKLRLYDGLLWAAVALFFIGLGLLLLAALLVAVAPEPLRPLVLGLLALGSLAFGGWLVVQARRRLASPAGALPATRAELARDRDSLRAPE